LPVHEVAAFFRRAWRPEISERTIERNFNQKWRGKDYICEVYGPVEWSQRRTLPPGVHPAAIRLTRSISRSRDDLTKPGGDIWFVYALFEYRGLLPNKNYELHFIGFFDGMRHRDQVLHEYEAWDEQDAARHGTTPDVRQPDSTRDGASRR
jgi:hypothetical protein